MSEITQSTAYNRSFLLVLSTDHITGATGKTPTVTISKAGGAFASPAGAASEIANGIYVVAYTAADTSTLGDLALHATASGCDATDITDQVISAVAGGDPLAAVVPGSYAAGTAGYVLGKFAGAQVQYVGPVDPVTGNVSLIQGDDYKAADGASLDFIDSTNAWPDLTSATVIFTFLFPTVQQFSGSIPVFTGAGKKLRLELTALQTQNMPVGSAAFKATVMLSDGSERTLAAGQATVAQT